MINLSVLFGGISSEHDISCISASNVIANLDKSKYNILEIGITKNGEWFLTTATTDQIADGSWETLESNIAVALSTNRLKKGFVEMKGSGFYPVDCIWPVLHGRFGEDGTVQGMCELAGIPFVGPGVCASANSIDKAFTKIIVDTTGVRQADYYIAIREKFNADSDSVIEQIEKHFNAKYPLFIKPACEGSSIGVFKVTDRQNLIESLGKSFAYDRKILVEENIVGREVEIAVLGNYNPKASVVGEVLASNDFYDFDAKYQNAESRTVIPAEITESESDKLRTAAVKIYKALECKGLSRVDFFLCENETVIFNEINTIPGFTSISMYPKLWEATGLPYSALLDELVEFAMNPER